LWRTRGLEVAGRRGGLGSSRVIGVSKQWIRAVGKARLKGVSHGKGEWAVVWPPPGSIACDGEHLAGLQVTVMVGMAMVVIQMVMVVVLGLKPRAVE
jgi:hypothetical protein